MFKTWKISSKSLLLILGGVSIFLLLLAVRSCYSSSFPSEVIPPNLINDVTELNPVVVEKVVSPKSVQDIQNAITSTEGKISIGGGRYSQGGQIALAESLHLDMRAFNKVVSFNPENKEITVQSGISWRDIQDVIDPYDLSIKIMQSYSNFTVGGSLSVNVHGRYMGEGPIIRSVKSIKVVLADGKIVDASMQHNPEIFNGVIGGYGGLGVIAEATLELVHNVKVERTSDYMRVEEYVAYFDKNVRNNSKIVFHNADLYPPEYTHIRSVNWSESNALVTEENRLIPLNKEYWWQPKAAEFVADSNFGKWFRQHVFEPIHFSSTAVQWRNYEASYDVRELEPNSREQETYALREYFVPVDHFDSFTAKMATIFNKHNVNVVNVSVRHALPDTGSLLAWAREEVFAFVVYYRQGVSEQEQIEVGDWSREMVDAALSEGGTYYLPYQLHATTEQFHKAYPRSNEFFELKELVDPKNRFSNKLWQQHYEDW